MIKNNKLKAVIFDLDGVIIDSEPIHHKVLNEILKDYSVVIEDEEYNTFIGTSNASLWKKIIDKYNLKLEVEDMCLLTLKNNFEYLKNNDVQPINGVINLLAQLKNNNILIGLASSSPLDSIELILSIFNIRTYFEVVVSGESVAKSKPSPEIFLKTAKLLGVKPKNCVVIEDSKNGVTAAKSATMKCIGFKNKNSGNQDISKADKIIACMTDATLELCINIFE